MIPSNGTIPIVCYRHLAEGRLLRGADDKRTGGDPGEDRPSLGAQRDAPDDPTRSFLADPDRTAADSDQHASERDQTASDSDQTDSDRDQWASDTDQRASEEDQAASDLEALGATDQQVRETGSSHREHAMHLRHEQSHARLRTGVSREITADERDQTAAQRDRVAQMRDAREAASDRTQASLQSEGQQHGEGTLSQAHDRQRAADDRARAAADRARAAADRARAADERAQSARERALAARDRAQAAIDRAASEVDELTHVRRRGAGMKQLQREMDRARRTHAELVVTFVDVDGLKKVNDTEGHLAGDSLLLAVADSLRACLRSYDLVMRYGGDEFVCALPNADVGRVRRRFCDVSSTLASSPGGGSISVGFAELDDSDSPEDLIHRADADLLTHRRRP
jgi:diguanylate cyclase (GGDEF)-like protein